MKDEAQTELPDVEVTPEVRDMIGQHPLPPGVPDDDMNQTDLAAALNVTPNTLSKWLGDDTFPMVQRGGMGRQYVLRLSHCYAWKMAREAAEHSKRRHTRMAIEKMQASFLGMEPSDPGAELSVKDRRALVEYDLARSKAELYRRQLVRLHEVTDLLDSILGIVRNGIEGMSDRLERELGLKPEEVALVERLGSDILNGFVEKIEAAELNEKDIADVMPSNQLLI